MPNMITKNELEKSASISTSQINDEINFKDVYETLKRHRKLVAGVTGLSVLLSGIYSLTLKPTWEGRFQIVLEDKQPKTRGSFNSALGDNSMLRQIAGLEGGRNSLQTEVTILESPSVLMPVYKFVKRSKEAKGIDMNGLRFTSWIQNVSINLRRKTSVLDIAYRDTDKEIILPVINLISQTYQEYSGRDRARGISQSVSYLEGQINELSKKADISIRKAQAFALDNGLPLNETSSDAAPQLRGQSRSAGIVLGASSIDSRRSAAQSKVDSLKQQLYAAKLVGKNSVYVAAQLEANQELYGELQRLQSNLEDKSALLKPNDEGIKALKRRISSMTAYINQHTIGLLEGKLKTAQAELASVSRPRDVVLKHRDLLRKALRDEKILSELEGQLQIMQLENARQTEPWELISTPTLLDSPVAPNKRQIVGMGLLGGLLLGAASALVLDRRRGMIFSKDELQRAIPCKLLKQLNMLDTSNWIESVNLLATGTLSTPSNGPIALIPVGNVPENQLQRFSSTLQKAIGERKLIVTSDLLKSRECSNQLLLACPGVVSRIQLEHLKMRLALQGKPLAGWVFLNPNTGH